MAAQIGRPRALACSLKKCIQDPLDEHMARVEVVTFETSREERAHMQVAWIDGRAAVFHDICWKAVVDSCKMDNPFSLCPLEKDMVAEARKTAEYFDSAERLRLEAKRISAMLKTAQYASAFTGAGISTSAGIGDFRGKNGKWTEMDRAKARGLSCHCDCPAFSYEALRPTYTHEAICKLVQLGYLKHVISQNTDGLHRLSGIPVEQLSELHGNAFIEKCEKCATRYERMAAVRRTRRDTVQPKICIHCHLDHRTGRKCERKGCDGYLMNIIINFGDSLELHVLRSAEEHARASDLTLCLGSSMRVTPACHLVEMGPEPTRLVLCNRQPTPMDKLCYQVMETSRTPIGSRVFGDCDRLMEELMKCLLSVEELHEWESGLDEREKDYAQQREATPSTD